MLNRFRRWGAAALAVAVALASCGAPAMATQPKIVQEPAKASKPGARGLFNDLVLPTSAPPVTTEHLVRSAAALEWRRSLPHLPTGRT